MAVPALVSLYEGLSGETTSPLSSVASSIASIADIIQGIQQPGMQGTFNVSSAPGLAGGAHSRTVIKGKKFRKQARIAKQIQQLGAIHEIRMVQSQRMFTVGPSRQNYDILGLDANNGNPTTGDHARGIMAMGDLAFIRDSIVGAAPAVANVGYRFVISKATASYYITNSTTANIDIILYDFIPRKDVYAIADSNTFPATKAWYTGMTSTFQVSNVTQAASTEGAVTDPSRYPGSKPFDSNLFCSWYKIIKTKSCCLSPGQCYTHVVSSYPRKIWEDVFFYNKSAGNVAGTDIGYLAKQTLLTFLVIKGGPVHDTGAGNFASIAQCAVDVVTSKVYKYAYGPSPQRSINTSVDLLEEPVGVFEGIPVATGTFVGTTIS